MAYPVKRDEVRELRDKIALNPKGAYLFWGEEEYLKFHYLGELREVVEKEGMAEFNITSLDFLRSDDIKSLEDAVDTLPVMAETRLIEVWGMDLAGLKKDEEKRLLDAIKRLDSEAILVIVARNSELDLSAKKVRERKIIKDLSALVRVVEFGRQSEGKLTAWVDKIFHTGGVRISDRNIGRMIALCDFSMTKLKSESDKLISFCRQNSLEEVPDDIVPLFVKPTAERETYEFTDAVCRHDLRGALEILENLRGQNIEPIVLVSMLAKTFNALAFLKSAPTTLDENARATGTGLFPWQIKKYTACLSEWTKKELTYALRETFATEGDLKSKSSPPYVLVESLVTRVLKR